MVSSRIVFLLGTLIAIAGNADAAASTCTGASGKFNSENNPGGTGVIACRCVNGYTAQASQIILGDVTLDCTKCAPGYYFSAGDGTTAGAVCTQAPANKYFVGGKTLAASNANSDVQTVSDCPTNSESVAGISSLQDCKVKAGYYIKTKATSVSDASNIDIAEVEANSYGAGGASAVEQDAALIAATKTACPYAGTSAAGSDALADCTPSCGTASTLKTLAQGGTCVCAATNYGKPLPANPKASTGAATQGCTAPGAFTILGAAPSGTDSGVTVADNTITFTAHGLADGDAVTYNANGGTAIGGLTDGATYYVRDAAANTIKLAPLVTTGSAIGLSGVGNNDQTLTPVGNVAHQTVDRVIGPIPAAAPSDPDGGITAASDTISSGFAATDKLHGIQTGTALIYRSNGGTAATGLTDGTTYYARTVAAHTFTLATTPAGDKHAIGGSSLGNAAQTFVTTGVRALIIKGGASGSHGGATSGVDTTNNEIDYTNHGLAVGDAVTYNHGGSTVLAGLTHATTYYVKTATANAFSLANPATGAEMALTGNGNNAQYFTTSISAARTFNIPTSGVTIGTEKIAFATHGLANGDEVTYNAGGGTAITGLTDGTTYFVVNKATGDFQVAATSGGTAIDLTGTGNNAQTFTTTAKAKKNVLYPAAACPANTEVTTLATDADGILTAADCKVKAGYYIATESDTATDTTSLVISPASGNYYAAGGASATEQTDGLVADTRTACPFAGTTTRAFVIPTTGVTISAETIGYTAHGLSDGDEVIYNAAGGTALAGLTDGATYFVVNKATDTFKVAATSGGTAIDLTGTGSNAQYFTVKKSLATHCTPAGTSITVAQSAVSTTAETITSTAHGLSNGDQITYKQVSSGQLMSPLAADTAYYVRDAATDTFKVASSPGGAALDITNDGHDAQYFIVPSSGNCGASTVNAEKNAGTCRCKANFYGTPVAGTDGVAASGCTACPYGGTSAAGSSAVTDCTPAAAASSVNVVTVAGTVHCKAGYYGTPTPANAVATGGCTACPANSVSVAGTGTAIADCKVSAGYYLSAAKVSPATYGTITQVAANKYAAGGKAVDGAVDTGSAAGAACPFGGTSAAGSSVVEDCVPDCGASTVNAVNARGTCICAPNYWGTPTSLVTVATTAVNTGTNVITVTAHGFADGDQVAYNQVSSGTLMAPLTDGTTYYVRDATANTFKLASTSGGTALVITVAGHSAQTFTPASAKATGGCTACPVNTEAAAGTAAKTSCTVKAGYYMQHFVIATSAIASNVITSNAHGLSDGDQVAYQDATATSLTAGGTDIADDTILYVRDATTNSFKLAATSGGTALVLAAGNNNQFFTNILQVPANSYGAGGASSSLAVANDITATKTACPYAGTSAAGSDALADCTPSCGTASTVKTAANGGTCVCASTHFGTPVDVNGLTTQAAAAGCAPIAQSAAVAESAITEATPGVITLTAHGYYDGLKLIYNRDGSGTQLTTGSSDAVADGAALYVVRASADTFSLASSYTNAMAGTKLQISNNGHNTQKFTPDSSGACPAYTQTAYTAAVAGTGTLADCEVAAGFRISVKSATITAATINAPGSMAASQVDANFYAPGAYDANLQASVSLGAGTSFACPFAGTTARAAGKLSDCTPNCGTGTNAVALGGTCVCASTHFGSPVDANGATTAAVTQGCSPVAQTVVIPQYAITEATPGVITLAGHGFYTGQAIVYNRDGTGTQLTTGSSDAVADGAVLYVIKISADTFKLQLTHAAAVAGTDLQISNDGHDTQRFTPVSSGACPTNSETAYTATGVPGYSQVPRALPILGAAPGTNPSGVTTGTDTFTYKAHSLLDGDELRYNAGGGTAATGLTDGNTYFVVSGLTDTFKVSATSGGSAVSISGVGTDNQFFTTVTSRAGAGTVADCKVKAGYYIATESATASKATGLVISSVPANSYGAGGASATEQDNAAVTATKSACVVKSTSPAGSDAISDCVTAPGFYLSVASPSATGSGRIAKSEVNKFSAGGTSISTTTAETATACTYGGTSAIGSIAAGCTPSCGTVADASSGTCVCKAGRTGTPTPTTATVTGGCTATLCAANQKVTSNACAACGAGTNNAAGDDASGADTTCDAISCTADHYVSSNVCTDCAAGSTNAAGDDATGADTTCDIVSGASPLEVKLTSMISFLVIGFLALAM